MGLGGDALSSSDVTSLLVVDAFEEVVEDLMPLDGVVKVTGMSGVRHDVHVTVGQRAQV